MGKIDPRSAGRMERPLKKEKDSAPTLGTLLDAPLLEEIKKIAATLRRVDLVGLADKTLELVRATARDRFAVAFVGEFSHGKSTLINRLLDCELLPTDDLPTTAMLTRITYGREGNITVLSTSGKKLKILPLKPSSWEGLTVCDSEGNQNEETPRNLLKVTVDNPWLRSTRIDILDTPGANDGSAERDQEISRALMATDGAVLCLDAQKGIMETQAAFIRDRLLAPRIPFMVLAITHMDLIEESRRERQLSFIMASLKKLNVDMPVVITNDVSLPSNRYASLVGIEKLRALLARWSVNPERNRRLGSWLAANVSNVLALGTEALKQQRQLIEVEGEERQKLIVEQQGAVTALHEEWEKLRREMETRCEECRKDFERRLNHEQNKILQGMRHRLESVPDPAKWYSQHYAYEIANRVSASIITLDNAVTENARNDFDWLNRELMRSYKAGIERDNKTWSRTEAPSCYVHGNGPDLGDISRIENRNVKINAAATAAGGVLGALLFGVGGLIGSVGASTATRFLTRRKVDEEIGRARQALDEFMPGDIEKIMREATVDSERRIRLIYSDIVRAARQSEGTWMQTRHAMIAEAARPDEESREKRIADIDDRIATLETLSQQLNKFIL